MKSYTDLEQSKKLAEILPLESADMVYVHTVDLEGDEHYDIDFRNNQPLFEDDIPCWSLAILEGLMPIINEYNVEYRPIIERYKDDGWVCKYYNEETRSTDDVYVRRYGRTPLDVVFEMICWLKENNKL